MGNILNRDEASQVQRAKEAFIARYEKQVRIA